MNKLVLNVLAVAACTSVSLPAQENAAAGTVAPVCWKDDFEGTKRYIIQRVDNDKEKAASCRREYKDGTLILYYKFGPQCSPKVQGTFVYGVSKPIDLKGGTALEIRYRTPVKGLGNILTWTYADATGKKYGDWTRLPASEEWKTVRIEMSKDGVGGQKKVKPAPVSLTALDILSSQKRDDVERSLEIDYICVPVPSAQ